MSQTNARFQGGGAVLPVGSSPGNINVGEKALIIDSDGVVKTQDAAGTKAAIGGSTVLTRAQQLLPSATLDTVLPGWGDFDSTAGWTAQNANNGTATMSVTDKGGVVNIQSSATASGSSIVIPAGAGAWIDNAKTSPWYLYARIKVGTVNANAGCIVGMAAISAGSVANPVFEFGILGSISTTNFAWHITNGAGANLATGTGPVLDTNWHAVEVTNDGTTLTIYFDGVPIGTTPSTNIGTVPWMFDAVASNGGTAANRTISIDKVWFVCQGN